MTSAQKRVRYVAPGEKLHDIPTLICETVFVPFAVKRPEKGMARQEAASPIFNQKLSRGNDEQRRESATYLS